MSMTLAIKLVFKVIFYASRMYSLKKENKVKKLKTFIHYVVQNFVNVN